MQKDKKTLVFRGEAKPTIVRLAKGFSLVNLTNLNYLMITTFRYLDDIRSETLDAAAGLPYAEILTSSLLISEI